MAYNERVAGYCGSPGWLLVTMVFSGVCQTVGSSDHPPSLESIVDPFPIPLTGLTPHHIESGAALDSLVNHVLAWTSRPEGLKELSIDQHDQDNQRCLGDLSRWKTALNNSELWAQTMVDSTSKFVTGILYGQTMDLGNFDECVESTPGTLGKDDDFTGLFALPQLTVTRVSPNNTITTKQLVKVSIAMCAPSTCKVEYLQTLLRKLCDSVNVFARPRGLHLDVALERARTSLYSGYRQPNARDWSIAAVGVFFAAIVLISTTIDLALGNNRLRTDQGWGSMLVIAFSAKRNGKKLLAVGSSDTLSCINGIRVFSMLWIVQGHRWKSGGMVTFTNAKIATELLQGDYAFMTFVFDALLSVDTFFVIGGIVNTYVFLKAVKKTNSFNILQYYIHRYVRLTPSLMFVLAVSATWLSLLGNGPLWYQVEETSERCQRAWWTHILYLGNYVEAQNQCHVLWYPNTDMQLFWVSPLILVPLWKRPRLGIYWLLFLIAVSCAVPLAISIANDYRFVTPLLAESANHSLWRDQYWGAHMRATPYFVGLLTGYFLYLVKVEKLAFKPRSTQAALSWLLTTIICMTVLLAVCPLYDATHVAYNKFASGLYIGLSKLLWSIGLSWIVVACVTGYSGPVNGFLSWPPFAVVGRLTYGIYLIHNTVQQVDYGLYRTVEYLSVYKMTHRAIADFFISAVLAAVLSLILESPILLIEKCLWDKKTKKCEAVEEKLPPKEKMEIA